MPSRKVAALTAEQLEQFRVVRDELLAAAVGTNPADRPAAEAAIRRMYKLSGLRAPRFIWCESPAAAHVALRVLAVDRTWLTPKVSKWSYDPSPVAYPQPLTRCHYPRAVGYLDGRPYADGAEALRVALERSLGAKHYLAVPMRQDVGMLERLLQHAVYDIPLRTIDGVIGNSARASLENSLPKVAWPASGKRLKPVGRDPGDRWVSAIAFGEKHYLAPDAFRGLHSGQHHSQLVNFEAPRRLGLVSYGAPGNEWLDCWCTLARSCGWFWPFERVCVAAERPAIVRVEEVPGAKPGPIVPHCPDGPAIVFPDGWEVHAWHGTGVPASLVEDEWDFKRILAERNVETRRCAIEKLGWEELERHLVPVASAPDPGNPGQVLTLCELPREIAEACGRARLLLCSNGTPEADGTRRRFGLLVPARHTDPVAAAAQTYGWSRRRYASLARRT
jgi:hypothetical protein